MLVFAKKLIENKFWLGLLFLILVVGTLPVLPVFLIWQNLDHSDGEFLLMQQNVYRDEFFQYMPRAREVYDGHFPPNGVYANETGPSPLNPLPPLVFSLFLRLFNGDVNLAYLTAQFFFASLIFLLFFILGLVLFRSKYFAVFFSLVGVLTQIPQLLFRYYDRDYLSVLFKKFIPVVRTPLDKMYFSRIDDPMLTVPFLLVALIALYFFWIKPNYKTSVLVGFFCGSLAYVYLHYFLFTAVFIGFLFILNWHTKGLKVNLKNFLILGGVFILILIPYLINYIAFNSLDSASDYSFRLGKEFGGFLVWDYLKNPANTSIISNHLIYLVTLALIYLFYFKRNAQDKKHKGIFFMGLVLTMFFVWHIPSFLGFGFALMHFNKPINIAIFIIYFDLVWLIINQIKNKFVFLHKILIITFITLSISLVSKHFINTFIFLDPPEDQLEAYTFPQELTSSWQWINFSLPGEPKIVSDSLITSLYLSSYTSARPYTATGFISTISNSELENRFLISNKLFSVSNNILELRMKEKTLYDCSRQKCFKDTSINFDKSMWYLSGPAQLFCFNNECDTTLKNYENMKVDWFQTNSNFVYYGPWEKQFSQTSFSKDSRLELIYKNPSIEIFKIKSDTL